MRGKVPDNSVVMGNPARVVITTDHYRKNVFNNPALYEYKRLTDEEKKEILLEKLK